MPFRAVRRQRLEPPADSPDRGESLLLESLDAYAQRMTEHEFFSHISAAVAWGRFRDGCCAREFLTSQ